MPTGTAKSAFDTASVTWLRSEGDTPAPARSGARLAARNVVALRVQLVDSGTKDPAGNPVPETVLVGTGSGTVVSGGSGWWDDDVEGFSLE